MIELLGRGHAHARGYAPLELEDHRADIREEALLCLSRDPGGAYVGVVLATEDPIAWSLARYVLVDGRAPYWGAEYVGVLDRLFCEIILSECHPEVWAGLPPPACGDLSVVPMLSVTPQGVRVHPPEVFAQNVVDVEGLDPDLGELLKTILFEEIAKRCRRW